MISRRTALSAAQLLAAQPQQDLSLFLAKHFLDLTHLGSGSQVVSLLLNATPAQSIGLLTEIAATAGVLRVQNTKQAYFFDQRLEDLRRCALLDGYRFEGYGYQSGFTLVAIEPQIEGTVAVDDDLSAELKRSGLDAGSAIAALLENSAGDFRKQPPDYNGCLTNARVALETLVRNIANTKSAGTSPQPYDPTKWGQILSYLRTSGMITQKEEEGLSGVYSFVSPGAHSPIGLNEEEFSRLGRSIVVSMCYFLLKRYNG